MIGSPIEEIKNRLDIVEVVGQYLRLQRAGQNWRALCPFHSEKKPSFFVSPARQIWHCFGCGAGGNIFDFVMKIEGIEFKDALRILADKAGVELKKPDPELDTARQRLYHICELATKFFEHQLKETKIGNKVKEYLISRGLKPETITEWRIGYAPDNWTALSDFLASQGYSLEEIEAAGLTIKKEDLTDDFSPNYYDRFRGRIMFPIFDIQDRVIGFGGRIFKKEDTAKYINSPTTLLYDKSRVLYGLNKAKVDIRKEDKCIVVEGYMDAIMLFQAGYRNVVAASGTALTITQLRLLKRYTDNLYLAFDMDTAGNNATQRGIDLAQQEGFNIRVIVMPSGKDPAEIIAENPSNFDKAFKEARNIMEFYFESALSSHDSSLPDGKKKIANTLLPRIAMIPNAIEKAYWRQKLADVLGVTEQDVEEELKKTVSLLKTEQRFSEVSAIEDLEDLSSSLTEKKSRKEILEEYIISILLKWKDKANLIQDSDLGMFSGFIREAIYNLKQSISGQKIATTLTIDNQLAGRFHYLLLMAECGELEEDFNVDQELLKAIQEMRYLYKKQRLQNLILQIKEAEKDGNSIKVNQLLKEADNLIREA